MFLFDVAERTEKMEIYSLMEEKDRKIDGWI